MDDSFEVIEKNFEDSENLRWEEDLKILNSKGLNNRNLLLNLLGELGSAENVFHYLRSSPQNEPRAVKQDETPEGSPLLTPNSPIQIDDYFCDERINNNVTDEKKQVEEEKGKSKEKVKEIEGEEVSENNSEQGEGETSPMILPPSFQMENESKEPDNALPKALSPTFKKFNSVIPHDMSASLMLSSPLQELIKPSEPCTPLNLDAILDDSSESPSLPIQLCKCVNDGITILPRSLFTNEEDVDERKKTMMMTKTLMTTVEDGEVPQITTTMDKDNNKMLMKQNLKNQYQIDSKGLLKARLRQHNELNIYIHFTDFFLAVLLTTFVWWTII